MADLSPGDAARQAVEAVLAVTPVHPALGDTLIGWRPDEHEAGGIYWPTYGDPAPIAARQAAAVLRWAADKLAAESEAHHAATGNYLFPLADWRVRGMAQAIEDAYPQEVGRGDRA